MRLRFWISVLMIAAGCATAQPVPPPADDTDEAKAKLDAAHRRAQADYDHAKAAEDAKKPK